MAWSAPTAAKLLLRLTPQESAGIKSLQGGMDTTAEFVSTAVAELRDYIQSGGYPVDQADATTLPLGLHEDCYAIARWNLAISVPAMRITQTEERKDRYNDAQKKGTRIANQAQGVEDPAPSDPPAQHIGSWNSEQKLVGRMHPVPPPSTQFPTTGPSPYANPDAPADN